MFLFGIVLFYIWLVYVKYSDFIELNRCYIKSWKDCNKYKCNLLLKFIIKIIVKIFDSVFDGY